uniref:Toll like receptor 5 n=1 Tax=Oreochromis niloticus TaxID=8128 RepID=I3IYJ3_ORENI
LYKSRLSYQTCRLRGQRAWCGFQNHYWVPSLPHNITHLYLQSNHITEINSTSLRDFKELQVLNLESQDQTLVIRNSAFLGQTKLTELMLGSNLGLKLQPRAFAGLSNLQNLSLYYCSLTDSILSESYLEPLLSLEVLDLSFNNIMRLRPGLFFSRFKKFTQLKLKLNKIENICEEDLVSFRGKRFELLSLDSNKLYHNDEWGNCGNPFKELAFNVLDLTSSGLHVHKTRQFFKAIEGTPISHLKYSGILGKGFSHENLPDPDRNTFEGLKNSAVEILDVSNNRIFALQSAVFSHLRGAKMIDISLNRINQINRNAFDGLQDHLLILNLSSNLLGEIHSHTFTNLRELKLLDLSQNHIGVLGYKAFSGLPNLEYLDLTSNSLRELGFPTSLPNLEYLFLRDNKLKSLNGIYDLTMNSIHVDISENRLTNLEDVYRILTYFPRLQVLFYGDNIIKWCKLNYVFEPLNNSLKVLDLHDSSLQIIWTQGQCLDLFDHLENLIGLNISLNSLTTLPNGIFRGLSSITEMDLSYNALTFLQPDVFPISLKWLHISNNFLASPDPMTFQSLSILSLSATHFHCDCNLGNFLEWLNTTNVTFLSPIEDLRCEFPAAFQGLPLLNYSTIIEPCEMDPEQAVRGLKFAVFLFSASLIITVLLTGIIYARLRGQIFIIYKKIISRVLKGPKLMPLVDEMRYDAFICFSNRDYRWVEAALLKKLDNQFLEENLFHCCFEARDFLPGEDHLSNIRDAIWSSRKTLCIVSKEFLKDGWCLEAFTLAQGRMLEELTNVLIMLVVGKVAHYQLMKCNAVRAFVQRKEYLTWPEDPQDMEWFYERLISDILKDSKVKKLKENKPEPGGPEVQPESHNGINAENIKETSM